MFTWLRRRNVGFKKPNGPLDEQARAIRLSVRAVDRYPDTDSIHPNELVVVGEANAWKWMIMRCPCGCRDLISLPAAPSRFPRWRIRRGRYGSVSLSPSIWRTEGCFSHFFVIDSTVYWCRVTGTPPPEDWQPEEI